MSKKTHFIVILLLCIGAFNISLAQTKKVLTNRAQNQDLCLEVNDGGVPTEALCVSGTTADINVPTRIGVNGNAFSSARLHLFEPGDVQLFMSDTTQAADNKIWSMTLSTNSLSLRSRLDNGNTKTNYLTLKDDKLGILQASPNAPLDVKGTGGAGDSEHTAIFDRGNTAVQAAIGYDGAGETDMYIGTITNHDFQIRSDNKARMAFLGTGDAVFGDASIVAPRFFTIRSDPANRPQLRLETGVGGNDLKLDVGGTADVYTDAAINLNIRSNGITVFQAESNGVADVRNDSTVGSATINWCTNSSSTDVLAVMRTCTSSKRYKHNIEDLPEGISERIYDLRPVAFENNDSDLPDYGLIAEEVNDHLPVLVGKDQNGRPENVNYRHMVALLIAEMKKLKDRIEYLEAQ